MNAHNALKPPHFFQLAVYACETNRVLHKPIGITVVSNLEHRRSRQRSSNWNIADMTQSTRGQVSALSCRFPPAEAEHAKLSLADMNVQSSEAAVAASQEHAASTHENGATARDGAHKKHKKSKLQLHSSAFFTAEDVNKRRAAWLERQQRQAVQDINAVRQALPIAAMR